MEKKSYYNNDICIVGIGCVLPDADNPCGFWDNILNGKCSIKKMSEERFRSVFYLSRDKNKKDKAYSNRAAFVKDDRLKKICGDLDLDFSKNNRLQIMSLEATRQALACLSADSLKKAKKSTSVFLGCMEVDEAFVPEKFFFNNKKTLKKYIEKSNLKDKKRIFEAIKKYFNGQNKTDEKEKIALVLTNSAVDLIKKKYGFEGEGVLVDAACASSLAALDVSVNALKNYEINLAITGGIESNLGPNTFVVFSKVGALSSNKCLPFDKKASGLSQGEGAVIFVLQRIEDALNDKNKIYGVIKSVDGSSDGKNSSLFSPSLSGQILAYRRTYKGFNKNSVDYIECHGTGTKIGDSMEINSLNNFFDSGRIPIGSVKSLIGHTKGAAGAVGLLKCILIMENKIISPSKYIKSPITSQKGVVYVNKKPIYIGNKEKILRFGVSSFGFGNINYHVILDEFRAKIKIVKPKIKSTDAEKIAVIGKGSAPGGKIDSELFMLKFKIPPKSIPYIDKIQLLALAAVDDAFKKSNIEINSLDRERVSVISASSLGLDSALDFDERIRHFEFKNALRFLDKKSLNFMINHKNKFPEATEDIGHGVLNNVIAGRICNNFDFKGKNFNVDSDFNSFPAALKIATREIRKHDGIIILIYCDEKLNKTKTRVERKNVSCILLSTLALAKKENYPIYELITKINYHE